MFSHDPHQFCEVWSRIIVRLLFGFDKLNQSTNSETTMLSRKICISCYFQFRRNRNKGNQQMPVKLLSFGKLAGIQVSSDSTWYRNNIVLIPWNPQSELMLLNLKEVMWLLNPPIFIEAICSPSGAGPPPLASLLAEKLFHTSASGWHRSID